MFMPYDDELGINPQDSTFLELEPWDWDDVRRQYPLLLHFHPLVIYRHQVLKQADVVLAMFLRGEHFSREQKRRNFDFYDPITTGDSSLSACVQAIVAAEVGYDDLALDYFTGRSTSTCPTATATPPTASTSRRAAGSGPASCTASPAWSTTATPELRPRLPAKWDRVAFHVRRHGSLLRVEVDHEGCTLSVSGDGDVPIRTASRR